MKIFRFMDIIPQIPHILFQRKLQFTFELIPYEAKRLTLKKIINFFLAGLNQFILPSRPFGYPVIAQIEPVNFCNLSCPLCLTASQTNARPKAMLSFEAFKKFIDKAGDYLLLIILWNWGEPFLNPEIFKMIAYAKSKNIIVHSSTNGNVIFDDHKAQELVNSGLDGLIFAVDGATQQTYGKYRSNGSLDMVISNIRAVVQMKKKMNRDKPKVNMRFVVMKHNESDMPQIKKLARQLEVDYLTFKTVDMPESMGSDLDKHYAPDTKKYRRYEYEQGSFARRQKPFVCMRPWKRITIDALGEVIPCEYDYKNTHSFGSIMSGDTVKSVWKSSQSVKFRYSFNLGSNDYYLCRSCTYKDRVADDCIVERADLLAG